MSRCFAHARVLTQRLGLELSVKSSEDELLAMAEKCTLGKLPLLETPQGVLFASNAILRHCAPCSTPVSPASLTSVSAVARVGKGHGLYGANNYEMVRLALRPPRSRAHVRSR